jgi:hypothetical protein
MTPLDQALVKLQENLQDIPSRHAFYDLFLNSVFYVPTYDEKTQSIAKGPTGEQMMPLIMQVDGMNYMVMFDSEERLAAWAEEEVHCIALPGVVLAEMSSADLHWGLNVGTDYQKQFVPDEIAWLKEVVEHSKAAKEETEQAG